MLGCPSIERGGKGFPGTSRQAGDMLTTGAHTETKRLGNQTAGRQMAGGTGQHAGAVVKKNTKIPGNEMEKKKAQED